MTEFQKCVIIVFPRGFQGKVWATLLHSQKLAVIWEAPDVHIAETLNSLKQHHRPLPDLLILDTRLRGLRPYSVCRWCQRHCPDLKIVLVNGAQSEVLPAERQWAISQGAVDLWPCFRRESLISKAVVHARDILDLMGNLALDQRSLVAALLEMGLAPGLKPGQASRTLKSQFSLMGKAMNPSLGQP